MFKLPGTPSPRAFAHELADYAEWVCWRDTGTSVTALLKDLGRLAENDYSDGERGEEEDTVKVVEEAYGEIERRRIACRDGYPFTLGERGYTLRAKKVGNNHKHDIYKYLLLATRLNMKTDKLHAEMDGTHLFEELAAEVGQSYFGARAEKFLFGTAVGGSDFPTKINALCEQMQEGVRFMSRGRSRPNKRDGKLDVVAWIPFTDNLPGKLIAFGQCKTGTTYQEAYTQLRPIDFCKKWLDPQPVLDPIRMFFVAEAMPSFDWEDVSIDAGLLFDRCRIVDYCDDIGEEVLAKVKAWTVDAAAAHLPQT